MALKTILVPIHTDGQATAVLEAATAFASRYDAAIEGVAFDLMRTEFVAADIYGATLVPIPPNLREKSLRESRDLFERFMRERSIAAFDANTSGPSQSWNDIDVTAAGGIESYARIFDITVYGRARPAEFAPQRGVLEATLFDSGRPILLAPPSLPKTFGETIVIAWNCSTESARTVAYSMPLLEQAKRVTVLTIEGGTVPGPSGQSLATNLRKNGIAADERTVAAGGRSVGSAILAEADLLGCDLLIKGAYTQSRLRQMIFGGATSHILTSANVPVVMAN